MAGCRIGQVLRGCGFARIADLSASRVADYLASRRQAGMSMETRNHYLRAVKHFTRWLVRDRRTPDDLLAHLPMLSTQTDRRHGRRALSADEFRRLIEAAALGPRVEGVSGPDRAMLYILVAWTGYRRKCIASDETEKSRPSG